MDETVGSREQINEPALQLDKHIDLLKKLYENPTASETQLLIFDQISRQLIDKLERNADWNDVVVKLPAGQKSFISRTYQKALIDFLNDVRLQIDNGVLGGIPANTLAENLRKLHEEHNSTLKSAAEAKQSW